MRDCAAYLQAEADDSPGEDPEFPQLSLSVGQISMDENCIEA